MLSEDGKVLLRTDGPDPKSGITTIEFHVAETGPTRLFVADVLGELALALIDEVLDPGAYTVRIMPEQLSSGMYLCVLQTPVGSFGRMIQVRK
jgi:hypothetical protein